MKKAANIKSLGLVGYGVATVKFITLFLSLALTISSLGVFAAKNRDFYNTFKSLGDYCVLFASIENEAILSSNDNCNYVIAGQTIASCIIIGCIVVLVLGKIIDTKLVKWLLLMCYLSSPDKWFLILFCYFLLFWHWLCQQLQLLSCQLV